MVLLSSGNKWSILKEKSVCFFEIFVDFYKSTTYHVT
jgi:hypothetical protein